MRGVVEWVKFFQLIQMYSFEEKESLVSQLKQNACLFPFRSKEQGKTAKLESG